MTSDELRELIAVGYETRGVEFKGPGARTENAFLARVVRALLGMANRRDGGIVILGVNDDHHRLVPAGLAVSQLRSWTYDDVADAIARYADPSIAFQLDTVNMDVMDFVVFHVDEFEDVPILCKRDYQNILRRGACYVRSKRKPETSEISAHEDFRALLDLATEKSLAKWVATGERAGVGLVARPGAPTDRTRFADERAGWQ